MAYALFTKILGPGVTTNMTIRQLAWILSHMGISSQCFLKNIFFLNLNLELSLEKLEKLENEL